MCLFVVWSTAEIPKVGKLRACQSFWDPASLHVIDWQKKQVRPVGGSLYIVQIPAAEIMPDLFYDEWNHK